MAEESRLGEGTVGAKWGTERVAFSKTVTLAEDEDPVLMSMCKLLASLIRVPLAGIGLLSRGSLLHTGLFLPDSQPCAPSMAAHALDSQILVVADTASDTRYEALGKECNARFYTSVRLMSSKGQCIGALYAMDTQPREGGLSAEHERVLLDIARIMAKKLEENYKRAVEVEVQARAQTTVLASLDKIRAPISACELTQTTFHILFANRSWAATAGLGEEAVVTRSLWELLKPVGETKEEAQARFWAASQSEQKNFAASFLLVSGIDKPQESTHLHFRAAKGRAARAVHKGSIREAMASEVGQARCYYFAMLEADAEGFVLPDELRSRGRSSLQTSRTASTTLDIDFDAVRAEAPEAQKVGVTRPPSNVNGVFGQQAAPNKSLQRISSGALPACHDQNGGSGAADPAAAAQRGCCACVIS